VLSATSEIEPSGVRRSKPPWRIPTRTPRAGFLTRCARSSGGPSSLARKADASCAFAPRRVASSETANEAVRRSAAETATRTGVLNLGAAVLSAFAERRRGRRSEKLAMFSIHERKRPWLRLEESAFARPGLRLLGVQKGEDPARIPPPG